MFDPSSPFLGKSDPLQPAQKTSFAEERLKSAVQYCELAPGTIATEAQIAERFGIGRAAIRVALARLSAMGLVQPIPRAGWKVLPVTGALIGDVIDARRRVEPALAETRPGPGALARMAELAEMIDVLEGQQDAATVTTRRDYERALLDILAGSATNALVAHFLSGLWDHSDRILRFLDQRAPGQGGAIWASLAGRAGALVRAAAEGDADTLIALRLADIEAFREVAADRLLRDRTELGAAPGAPETDIQDGRNRPDDGPENGPRLPATPGAKSNRGVDS